MAKRVTRRPGGLPNLANRRPKLIDAQATGRLSVTSRLAGQPL